MPGSRGGGGITFVSLHITSGKPEIDSLDAAELDAVAAKTAGSYSKGVWSANKRSPEA